MKKIASLLLWIVAFGVLCAIVYYNPHNPTWWFQTTEVTAQQGVFRGIIVYLAACCLAAVGSAALLIPVIVFMGGMYYYIDRRLERIQTIGSAMIIIVLLTATFCEHYHINFRGAPAGGVWGRLLYTVLSIFVPSQFLPLSISILMSVALYYIIGPNTAYTFVAYVRYGITRYIVLPLRSSEPVRAVQPASSLAFVPTQEACEEKTQLLQAQDAKYHKPPLSVLLTSPTTSPTVIPDSYESQAKILEEKLEHFGITGKVVNIIVGPVVVLFEYQPHNSVPINKIVAREYDLALALQATSFRIIAPIPGKAVVGLEMSRATCDIVSFARYYAELSAYDYRLPLLVGVTTEGAPVVLDLTSLPHLLVAGSTGSGKSVALHALIVSIISTKSHEETRLILIDPKRLEFAVYADIPHLLFPIVVEAQQAVKILRWAVQEMDRRYGILSSAGVTDIAAYRAQGQSLVDIVVIVDEWADLMMSGGRDAEQSLVRLAQMARAAGIHLIIATQRPSVDVITGLIKVNIPARIACKVISKVDSRTILDTAGAEKLLGKGDMLLMLPGKPIMRVHGVYISVRDVQEVACYTRRQGKAVYCNVYQTATTDLDIAVDDRELYEQVLTIIKSVDEISISYLQRKLRIGYNRSARMIDYLEAHGMILPSDGGKTRKVLHSKDI